MDAVKKPMVRADGFNNFILGSSHDRRFMAAYNREGRSRPEYAGMHPSVVVPCLRRLKNVNQGETDKTRRDRS
jgi:hypothetical protein